MKYCEFMYKKVQLREFRDNLKPGLKVKVAVYYGDTWNTIGDINNIADSWSRELALNKNRIEEILHVENNDVKFVKKFNDRDEGRNRHDMDYTYSYKKYLYPVDFTFKDIVKLNPSLHRLFTDIGLI